MNDQLQFDFDQPATNTIHRASPTPDPRDTAKPPVGQLAIDFDASYSEASYAKWVDERHQRMRRIAQLWGLPLSRKVRVTLEGDRRDYEGILCLRSEPNSLAKPRPPLQLQVGERRFCSNDITALAAID